MGEPAFCYLTTRGRATGQPHRIEIWFTYVDDDVVAMLAGGRRSSDWVRNIEHDPAVTVEIDGVVRTGRARVLAEGEPHDALARERLVGKYATASDDLVDWGRTALGVEVAIEG